MVDLSAVRWGFTGGVYGACLCPCTAGHTALVCRPAGADGVAIARGAIRAASALCSRVTASIRAVCGLRAKRRFAQMNAIV